MSARHVPLPESVADLDVDSVVSPDDSISQVGLHGHRHRSHRSKSSRADDQADAMSQASRASHRTVKAGEGSRAGSRRGSQVA